MRALADAITFRLLDMNYNLREEKLSFSFSFETQSLALPLCVFCSPLSCYWFIFVICNPLSNFGLIPALRDRLFNDSPTWCARFFFRWRVVEGRLLTGRNFLAQNVAVVVLAKHKTSENERYDDCHTFAVFVCSLGDSFFSSFCVCCHATKSCFPPCSFGRWEKTEGHFVRGFVWGEKYCWR